jgi:fucose 4-O-acetylase-like acetyltransferase
MGTASSQAFSNSSPKLQESERKRDIRIDLLKTIGIFCIIFAHTSADTDLLYQVRNFDVSLMVISSGILFSYSTQNKPFSFWKYLKVRIPRLIAPVWAFIIFYFASAYPISLFLQQPYPFSIKDFWQGLILVGGSSYFWIIRVFILVAMLSPVLVKLQKRLKHNEKFSLALILIYIAYEAIHSLILIFDINLFFMSAIFHNYISYVIPYGFLFGLGMVLAQSTDRFSMLILGIFLFIFLAFSIYSLYDLGHLISTQRFKYPPELYYLSYGIFLSTGQKL